MTYTIIENENHSPVVKLETKDGQVLFIPMDESNSDYQAYLRWLENPDADENGTL